MKSASRIALSAMLLLGVAAAAQPALAKRAAAPPQPTGPGYTLTKEERAAIAPLQAAAVARNWSAAAAALPAAQAGARGSEARYIVAGYQLQIAVGTGNVAMQSQAIDALIASGRAPASDIAILLHNQAALAAASGNRDRREAAVTRLLEVQPNNADALIDLAKIKADKGKTIEAVTLIDRAIAVRESAGQRPPESWYSFALRLAVDNKMAGPGNKFARGLAASYPSPENWRDAILAYLDLGRPGEPAGLDAWRLLRATRGLGGERDFLQFAQAASTAGLAAEAKAVLDEGVARRMVDPAKPIFKELIASSGRTATAERKNLTTKQAAALAAPLGASALTAGDAFFGYGDYASAAALYRAAAQKGGVDPGLANIRLGAALALAGQRAEAEAAFRSITGPGSDLAGLWLAWLRQPA